MDIGQQLTETYNNNKMLRLKSHSR